MKKICSFLLVIAMLFAMTVTAHGVRMTLSDDSDFLYIEGTKTMPDFDNRFKDVKEIYFSDCVIDENLSSSDMPKLNKIVFDNCEFDIRRLRLPDTIKELTFKEKIFEDISFVNYLSKLNKIEVYNCELKNLEAFSGADKIKEVCFYTCTIGSLNGIEGMTSIEYLSIDDTKIEAINGIEKLTNLKYLSLIGSAVKDISLLKNMNITQLNVDDCVNIKSLDPVMQMPSLENLFADNCEMAVSEKLIDYLAKNDISSNLNKNSLKIKNDIKKIYKSIIKKGMTEEEIIGTIVKYVCEKITYDINVDFDSDLSFKYGDNRLKYALAGKGCCTNYTTLATALFREAGIECYEISGENHVWNLVKLGKYHYWLDCTWIDTDGKEKLSDSSWFMASDNSFVSAHRYFSLPSSVYLNANSFDGTYKQSREFYLGTSPITEEKLNENATEEESTTEEETTEETTVPDEETEVTTEEQTTKYKGSMWYTETFIDEDEGKTMGKVVVIVFSISAVVVGAFFVIRKIREGY